MDPGGSRTKPRPHEPLEDFGLAVLVALVRKDASGALSDRVWLLQQEQDPWIVDMNLTLAQYVELAYRARGFHHWQLAYLNRNDPTFARMKFALPKMFPTATFGESIFESSP
jgi:hypothetical protein